MSTILGQIQRKVEGGSTGGERNFQLSRRKDIQGRLASGGAGQPVVIANFLKGPKLEIFVAGIFTQIRPVRTGDLETRPKNEKSLWLGSYIYLFSCVF
jgi:hypothetical protein